MRSVCWRQWMIAVALTAGLAWSGTAIGTEILGCSFDDARSLVDRTRLPGWRILDRRGRFLGAIRHYYAPPVDFADLPPHLIAALVTNEDRRFFEHDGLDYWGMLRALNENLRTLSFRQGASTITQQTLKNACIGRDVGDLQRKLLEAWSASDLEASLGKTEILYVYLNSVPFGRKAHGIEAAARVYFAKPARNLTLLESALLVQLLPAPETRNPFADRDGARQRAFALIDRMVEIGKVTTAAAARAKGQKFVLASSQAGLPGVYPRGESSKGWAAQWVRSRAELTLSKEIGVAPVGFTTVRSTIDLELQGAAERRLTRAFKDHAAAASFDQGAVLVLDHQGDVLAMVGGRDFGASQWNAATQASRQPGSAFKLFPYLAAIESGGRPQDKVLDQLMELGSGIKIRNFDERYRGLVPLEEAFAHSSNPAAIRLTIGRVPAVIGTARRLGVQSPLSTEVGVALGISEVTLLELTQAYAVIANGGLKVVANGLIDIRANDDRPLWCSGAPARERVVARDHVAAMRKLLASVVRDGTGHAADPGFPAYGKTGTTDGFRDAWFVGFTDRIVVGVWLGNERQGSMKGVTGGGLPATIFKGIVQDAQALRPWPRPRPSCALERTTAVSPIAGVRATVLPRPLDLPVPRPRP